MCLSHSSYPWKKKLKLCEIRCRRRNSSKTNNNRHICFRVKKRPPGVSEFILDERQQQRLRYQGITLVNPSPVTRRGDIRLTFSELTIEFLRHSPMIRTLCMQYIPSILLMRKGLSLLFPLFLRPSLFCPLDRHVCCAFGLIIPLIRFIRASSSPQWMNKMNHVRSTLN